MAQYTRFQVVQQLQEPGMVPLFTTRHKCCKSNMESQ